MQGISAVALYNSLDKIMPKRLEFAAKDKLLERDIKYLTDKLQKIEEPEELLKDYRSLKIMLDAFGLESEIDKIGLIRGVMLSDPGKTDSLVNRMNDARYRDMHAMFRLDLGTIFAKLETTALKFKDQAILSSAHKALDEQAPGLRRAIHMRDVSAEGGISTPYHILSDPNLRDLLLQVRDIPKQIVIQPVTSQAQTLEKHYDFARFDDTRYVDRIIQQYLAKIDQSSGSTGAFDVAGQAAGILGGTIDGIGAMLSFRA